MLKAFMTFWATVRRFRDLIGTGFLTLIPIVNIIFTWHYAGKKCSNGTVDAYYRRMVNNIEKGYSAFDNTTRGYWMDLISIVLMSALFIVVSVGINWYAFSAWPSQFDYEWIVRYNLTFWYQIAGLAITAAILLTTIGAMLNKIYQAHKRYDPTYMSDEDKAQQKDYVERVLSARKVMS